MPSAAGSNVLVRYYKEASYKTPPGPVGSLKRLRNVRESLKSNLVFIESNEVTQKRTTIDTIPVDLNTSGTLEGEMSYGAYDEFFEAALQSDATWSTPITATGATITVTATNKYHSSSGTPFTGILAGDIIRTESSHTAANDGWHVVTVVDNTSGASELTVLPADLTVDAVGASGFELKSGARIRNGILMPSFGIERVYQDVANEFPLFDGQIINTVDWGIAARRINDVRFGLLGATERTNTATTGTSADTAAPTNPVMNAVRDVKVLREAHAALRVISFNYSISNNVRSTSEVATFGAVDQITGSFSTTGQWQAYYRSKAIAEKALAITETNLFGVIEDALGNSYAKWFPRVKIEDFDRAGGGKNTDVLYNVRWRALESTVVAGEQMQIARFAT